MRERKRKEESEADEECDGWMISAKDDMMRVSRTKGCEGAGVGWTDGLMKREREKEQNKKKKGE